MPVSRRLRQEIRSLGQQIESLARDSTTPDVHKRNEAAPHIGVEAAGTAHSGRALELAKALLKRLGQEPSDDNAKKLLDAQPGMRVAVKLFSWASGDEAVEHARCHCVVNTDDPLHKVDGDGLDALRAYARQYGYQDVKFDGVKLTVVQADGNEVVAGKLDAKSARFNSADEWLRALGRLVNEKRVGAKTAVPPLLPVDLASRDFTPANALVAGHLSMLAYESEPNIKAQLERWGFDMSTFSFIENKGTDTQGFVCVDKQGHLHVCFRGSSSREDVGTDITATLETPSWAQGTDIKVHRGFNQSLESVWGDVEKALEKAKVHDRQLFFSGHSLGGALTQLCAAKCLKRGFVKKDGGVLYTEGGPRIGNGALKQFLESSFPRMFRMVHVGSGIGFDNDPVTGVPPKFMGYRHAGNMVKIDDDKAEVIMAGATGNRSALESVMMRALDVQEDLSDPEDASVEALRGAHLAQHASEIREAFGTVRDAIHGDGDAQDRLHKGLEGARAMALESRSFLGVGLHFMAGYLEAVGKEVLRKL